MNNNLIEYNIRLSIESAKKLSAELYNFKSDIDLLQGRYMVDAKSIIGIFSLDLTKPITLKFYGDNEEEINKLNNIVRDVVITE